MNRPPNMPLPPPPTQAQAPPVPQSPAPKREVLSRAPHRPTDRSDDTPVLQSPAPKREVLSRADLSERYPNMDHNLGADTIVVKASLRKLCVNTFGNKWQSRYVRIVEPSKGKLLVEYSKKEKDFDKASQKIKRFDLAHPGFIEISEQASKHHTKLPEDDNHCLEFHVQGERDGHGRALVFRFDDERGMKEWEKQIHGRFGYRLNPTQPPPPPPGGDGDFGPGSVEVDHNEYDDEALAFDADEEKYEMVEHDASDPEDSEDEDEDKEEFSGLEDEVDDEVDDEKEDGNRPLPPSMAPKSSSPLVKYNEEIHLKKNEVSKQITFSGLSNHQVDIDVLTEEALETLDVNEDEDYEFVHRDALLRWIIDKKEEQIELKRNATVLPVPSEESTIKREETFTRHLSGFTAQQLQAIQSPSLNNPSQIIDVRTSNEKRQLFPTQEEKMNSLHNRNSTMYTLSAIQEVTTKAAEREAVRLGLDPTKLDLGGSSSANNTTTNINSNDGASALPSSAMSLYNNVDDLGDNWNEKFLQAHEMPILKHHDAMVKGKKLYDLDQKMSRLASIAAKTIVDEFALPAKLKKIKPLEWYTQQQQTQPNSSESKSETETETETDPTTNTTSNDNLSMDIEDGMENDLLYSYQGLLIRIVGINKSITDAETSRKVTGHEVRGINIFREASTTIKQEMISDRQLQLSTEGLAMEHNSLHIPEVHTTNAYVVDYMGFRLLVTTIPPIDEEFTLRYGRLNPLDPNSNLANDNQTLFRLLTSINYELNLKEHRIITDGCAKLIPLGSEIQGHECSDGRFYAVNMSRLMPPDLPNGGSDVTTKLLRPELVQDYNTSLSSDSFSSILNPPQNAASSKLLNDSETNDINTGNASRYLREVRIPEFVAMLDTLSIFPYESYTLTKALHAHGINIRHLGKIYKLTKLPHIRDLIMTEMIARTAKDILNENQRKQIVDAYRHVLQLVNDLAKQGRHLNDDAMAQLLEYNVAVTDDANRNVIDYFNLILGSSTSTENHLFWSNILVPRLKLKFNVNVSTKSMSRNEEDRRRAMKEQERIGEGTKDSTTKHVNDLRRDPPIRVTRSTTNAKQLFHALQYHLGARFIASEHYEFDDLARPFTEQSQLLETYPKVKSYTNRSLEVNRVAEAAEIYRDSGQLDIALVAYKLRAQKSKNLDHISNIIELALANNNIANIYRLMAKRIDEHDRIYLHDNKKASAQRMREEGLEYTKLALINIPHTHAIASRIYETRMKLYSDSNDLDLCAVSFGMGIKALLNHFGDSGHHPLVAELHCMYGSLISEHTTTSFNMYGAGGAMNATNFNYINLAKKNLEKAKRLASKIMGPKHPILSTYACEVARIDLISGDTYSALEHYQQALLLLQSSIGTNSLEASTIYYEMANIKQKHSSSNAQIEAEEGLVLAEKALQIRETIAMMKAGSTDENGEEMNGSMKIAMEMSSDIHITGALTSVSGNINDMLVQSYRQVAALASDERQYERSMICYERLIICLRSRKEKTETSLKLMQKAIREIVSIKMIELKPSIAEKVRKIHALHDPHKKIHEHNKIVFMKVIQTVMKQSPGEYFEMLMTEVGMYGTLDTKTTISEENLERKEKGTDTSQIELACLVELSGGV